MIDATSHADVCDALHRAIVDRDKLRRDMAAVLESRKQMVDALLECQSMFQTTLDERDQLCRDLAASQAERERYKEALEWISHHEGPCFEGAKTLHYDMRGCARAALATPDEKETNE
jgi:hypothetical protein